MRRVEKPGCRERVINRLRHYSAVGSGIMSLQPIQSVTVAAGALGADIADQLRGLDPSLPLIQGQEQITKA